MGLWNKVKEQFRSVIEWDNPNPDSLFFKWTDDGNEIKNASKLVVGPGQGCIFVHEGKLEAVITDQGVTDLKTANIPFWTTITSFMQKFQSEHKVGIYFFKTTELVDQKWGTPSIIKYQDPKYNFPVGLRAYGNFSFRIADPAGFFSEIVGSVDNYQVSAFNNMMKSRMLGPLADFFAESKYSYADIDAQRNELADGIKGKLIDEFVRLGFEITDFKIEGTSFDEDTMKRINRIADMTAEAQAAAAVGLNYADIQKLDALKAAASNEGGAAGMGMVMGAGMGMGQMMAGMMGNQNQQPAANDPTAKLGKLKQMLDGGLITQAEFDAKKKEILAAL